MVAKYSIIIFSDSAEGSSAHVYVCLCACSACVYSMIIITMVISRIVGLHISALNYL